MSNNNSSTKNKEIVIHTDGGAKGNPGPAAIGAVIRLNGKEEDYSKKIEETTNNVAEYRAAIFALENLKQLLGKEESKKRKVHVKMDSQLVVRQINGEYKVKEPKLKDLFVELWNIKQDFGEVSFEAIPREENQAADELVSNLLNTLV